MFPGFVEFPWILRASEAPAWTSVKAPPPNDGRLSPQEFLEKCGESLQEIINYHTVRAERVVVTGDGQRCFDALMWIIIQRLPASAPLPKVPALSRQ